MSNRPDQAALTAYVLGEGTPEERARIEAGIQADPALAAEVARLRQTAGYLHDTLRKDPQLTLSPDRRAELEAALRRASTPEREPWYRVALRPYVLGPVAVTALVLVVVWQGGTPKATSPVAEQAKKMVQQEPPLAEAPTAAAPVLSEAPRPAAPPPPPEAKREAPPPAHQLQDAPLRAAGKAKDTSVLELQFAEDRDAAPREEAAPEADAAAPAAPAAKEEKAMRVARASAPRREANKTESSNRQLSGDIEITVDEGLFIDGHELAKRLAEWNREHRDLTGGNVRLRVSVLRRGDRCEVTLERLDLVSGALVGRNKRKTVCGLPAVGDVLEAAATTLFSTR